MKILFSKSFVISLLIIFQFALFWAVVLFFERYIIYFQLICAIIGTILALIIINKKEIPEFKLPWLVIITLFPVFGIFIYILFANPRMKKSDIKRLLQIQDQINVYKKIPTPQIPEAFQPLEHFLRITTKQYVSCGNQVNYFADGREFWQDLLSELENAQQFIFLEYFIIEDGVMWQSIREILLRKVQAGVDVRLLYDDIGTIGKLHSNFARKLRALGIKCYKFNPFRPILSGIYNNRDHRKITIIDGKVGYTGGLNIGDAYINQQSRFGHWKDSAVKIIGPAVDNLTELFLYTFDVTAQQFSDYGRFLGQATEQIKTKGFVFPFGDGPKPNYYAQVGKNNYLNLINQAQKYVYITTPYLIIDHNLSNALCDAALKGIDVRIITPHIPDKKIIMNMTRANYPQLLAAGVKIYEYTPGFMHAKMMLVDDHYAVVGTINLDYRSLVHHYECAVMLYDVSCLADIKQDFVATFDVSQQITIENFRMSRFAKLTTAVLMLFAPLL